MRDNLAVQTPTLGAKKASRRKVANETVVHDRRRNRVLMRFAGVLVLPVGAEIERTAPLPNAKVVRVRLLAPTGKGKPVTVCLDVDVPE